MRKTWLDEGILCEDPSIAGLSQTRIVEAWDDVVRARTAYLGGDLEEMDRYSRSACMRAATALMYSRGLRPTGELSVRDARTYCTETFGVIGEELFTRAELVGEFLPFDDKTRETHDSLVRRAVAASSEVVALIECRIAAEGEGREPDRTDPYRYRGPGSYV